MDAATEPLGLDQDAEHNYGCAIEYDNKIVKSNTMLSPESRETEQANAQTESEGASLLERSWACLKVKLPKPELQRTAVARTAVLAGHSQQQCPL